MSMTSENTHSEKFKVQRQGQKWPCLFVAAFYQIEKLQNKILKLENKTLKQEQKILKLQTENEKLKEEIKSHPGLMATVVSALEKIKHDEPPK